MRVLKAQLSYLQSLLRRRGATHEQAEDLVQEAVLRLHLYILEGNEVRDEAAFLTRTAMNLATDAHRHGRVDRYVREPVEKLNIADLAPPPDEVFAAEQRLNRMKETLDRLSARTREVFFMHRLLGYSHSEIAQRFGISVSAVEKHVASAVTALALERQCK